MLFIIAWKNVWRNKVRSLIVILAVCIGLFAAVFSAAFIKGLSDHRIRSAIENEVSSVQIHSQEYLLNKEINDTIQNIHNVISVLEKTSGIKAFSNRIKINAMAQTATTGTSILVYGIDPVQEKKVTGIYKTIIDTSGSYFSDNKKNSVLIGQKLADKLKIKLKSKIIINLQSSDGTITSAAFKVTGIYKTGNTTFDEYTVYTQFNDLSRLLGFNGQTSHEIAILAKDNTQITVLKNNILQKLPEHSVMTWKEISPDLGMIDDMVGTKLIIILLIILLALCFGIINTMLMAILERTREIGMLMAVGMNKFRLFFMIMLESVFLTLTGGAAGIGIAILVIMYFKNHGIDLSNFSEGLEAIGFSTIVYPAFDPEYFFKTTFFVILTGILSAITPARRALKLNPVEAIRE